MPIIDALLLYHVSWVIGFESGPKKIGSSQRYEVEKLAQYQWDIRYGTYDVNFNKFAQHLSSCLILLIIMPFESYPFVNILP